MNLLSRRSFLKLSAFTLVGLSTQLRLPVFANAKAFKPFKFAFVPDMHLSTHKFDDWILLNESLIIIQDTLKQLNSSDVDFIVFGGDLVDNEHRDFADLSTMLDLLYTVEKPYYVIFGDREARLNNNLSKEYFAAEFRRNGFMQRGRTYWAEQPLQGLDLIGLDSSVVNQMDGELSPNQMVWLSDQLKRNPANFKIVVLHHPLNPGHTLNNFYNSRGFELKNSSAVIDLLDRNPGVDLVLSAHHHLNLITERKCIYYINSPSIVTYPCEYKIIEVNDKFIDIKSVPIAFKQMIKKAEDSLKNSKYSEKFSEFKPKEILKLQKGDKQSRDLKIKL